MNTETAKKLIPSEPLTEMQKGIEEGYQSAINDAEAGLLRGMGIFTTAQVKDYIDMYKSAIQQSILNDIKGIYKLGESNGHELRLAEQVIKEADSKFSGLLKKETHARG
jgi:hypothetical protein